jgi:hypothetical protein
MGKAAALACICAVLMSMAGLSEATMARITCHCDVGEITGTHLTHKIRGCLVTMTEMDEDALRLANLAVHLPRPGPERVDRIVATCLYLSMYILESNDRP